MPQRFRIVAGELRSAAPTLVWPQGLDVVTLVDRNQGSLVFFVTGLPATFLLRLAPGRLRPGVWMLRAGRQRGVLGRLPFRLLFQLLDPRFQFRVVRQQRANDSLGFGWLTSNAFFSNSRRHATVVAECRPPCPGQFIKKTSPGCERLPAIPIHQVVKTATKQFSILAT
jgi:hypothetical protein